MTITAGIYGATGYTGLELVQISQVHPAVEIGFVTSKTDAGESLATLSPSAPDLRLLDPAQVSPAVVDVVFFIKEVIGDCSFKILD